MCRRLANSVLPYAPKGADIPSYACQAESVAGTGSSYADHDMVDIPSKSLVSAVMVNHITNAITLLHNAEELVRKVGYRKAVSKPLSKTMKAIFDGLFLRLCGLYFPNREVGTKSNYCRVSQSLLLWDVVRYTMMSTELASRTSKENRIYGLPKAVLNEPVLPSLIWAARISQSQNRQSVLLRSRGMQLLVGSICFGGSRDSLSEPLIPGRFHAIFML
jgi:E3 ubiquitin-protein ligase UBR3